MKKIIFIASLFALLLLFNAENSFACSCAAPDPNKSLDEQVKEQYENASKVFSAKVLSVTKRNGAVKVKLKLLKSWKGKSVKTITMTTGSNSAMCGYNFVTGKSYLIYAYGEGNELSTNLCSRTAQLSMTKDIPSLEKMKKKGT